MTDTEMNDVFSDPSMEPHDLSQLQYHITLRDFGEKLQKAANAAYPNDQKMPYTEDLKIVYYGGHGMLAQNRQPCWASIEFILDWFQAQSDVLLLLDCCSSGTANTGAGYGTTELIAACGFNDVANGVGRHSFTYALTTELRLLSSYPKFTAAVLYNRILCRIQNWMPEGRELQKAPLHVVLTQNPALPSSIQLSVKPKPKPKPTSLRRPSPSLGSPSPASFASNERAYSDQGSGSSPMSSLLSADEKFPRILLSVRLKEDLTLELSADLFAEWLRMMPAIANSVTIEAKFSSFSTLILVSMLTPMWICLGKDPAFTLVGIIKKNPNIKIVSASTCSPLEVAESDNYQSSKTKQQPPACTSEESPLSADPTQNLMPIPSFYDQGFGYTTPYPHSSSYYYPTVAAEIYTPNQALAINPLESGREIYQITQEDTPAGKLLTRDDGIQGSKTPNLQTNRKDPFKRTLEPLAMAASQEVLMEYLDIDSETCVERSGYYLYKANF
ncbi:hypothetical protein BCON_0098g00030 [Botryotinia convoluta]|uniref:Uncharacterized protein n=1 Tax=Botryotinia convoluta TaxID=54673 RepID=A0A4Z1I0L2_9HELO|nr:hypothetical protein BCON_0098g00030 [Botryotinia convoluta]